ncbi:hypothetical protein [Jiulongibacter sediminis]|uniref:hypothetical protein n=1 Tax=Jiulongibacter sediminis TaxID=1605367 RepID=UPI0026F1460D|nr:hypothetical protein [Jiulongibacter sediminis]
MKRLQLLPMVCLLFSLTVLAQEWKEEHPGRPQNRLALKAGYFGELVLHPGLTVGLDYTVSENKWLTIHWDTDLGGYRHRWNNSSAFLTSGIGFRIHMGPVFTDFSLGIGYMHTRPDGVLFEKTENGDVEPASNRGHSHFMPNSSLQIGLHPGKNKQQPLKFHFGPEVYLQSSFNHTYLPHLAAKIGLTYQLQQP